jgi:hypothetical protein
VPGSRRVAPRFDVTEDINDDSLIRNQKSDDCAARASPRTFAS